MKKKLTLTIDADLVPLAKSYAHSQGLSLSSLVERSLRELAELGAPSFTSKWRGQFKGAESEGDARYNFLARKYLE